MCCIRHFSSFLRINAHRATVGVDNNPIKLSFLNHLVETCKLTRDKLNEFWVRKEIADIHYQNGKMDLAINELLQIAKEQKAGKYSRISFTYDLLAGLYTAGADFDKAFFYSLETIKNINTRPSATNVPPRSRWKSRSRCPTISCAIHPCARSWTCA